MNYEKSTGLTGNNCQLYRIRDALIEAQHLKKIRLLVMHLQEALEETEKLKNKIETILKDLED